MIVTTGANESPTQLPQQASIIAERMNRTLLKIVRDNFNTQYAIQAPILSEFRDAVAAHGHGTDVDAALLADFRAHVPLSNYDCYKPFVDKFNAQPCRKEDVENLLAPGLPDFFASSSATFGLTPKFLPKYDHNAGSPLPRCPFFDPNKNTPLAALQYFGHMAVKEVEHPGQVVQRIPICLVTSGTLRRCFGWKFDDDNSRTSLTMPYYAVPWAATIINHAPSFLAIHGLFFLARRDIDRFFVLLTTGFVDLIHHIDEQWDMLVYCIRNGIIPDLEGIDHVRKHLEAQLQANPERATELSKIGPPSSCEGWASHVWPKLSGLYTICSGPFSPMLPKIRLVLGPNISIFALGYGSSECAIAASHDNKPDEFVLLGDELIEFLDVTQDESHKNICQAWEVEVGKQYEPILTTRDGLWRYQLGDILSIIGFIPESNSPIFKFAGRKSFTIPLPHANIADFHLLQAINAIRSEDTIQVQEFTTVLDDRTLPLTVGYFVELQGSLGPNAHLAPQKLFDALVAIDPEHQRVLQLGKIRLPSIRIVRAGTFAEYRHRKAQRVKIGSGQIKVPLVLVNPALEGWMLGKVIQEL